MIFHAFFVRCNNCGHKNRPDKNVRASVMAVLSGTWRAECCGCNTKFTRITVPNRPVVAEISASIAQISEKVTIVDDKKGSLMAIGK